MSDTPPSDAPEEEQPADGLDASDTESTDEPPSAVERVDDADERSESKAPVLDRVKNARGDPEDGLSEKFKQVRDRATGRGGNDETTPPEVDDSDFAPRTTSFLQRFAMFVQRFLIIPLVAILQFVPRSDNLADMMIRAGFRMKRKLARADGVTMVLYGDGALIPQANQIHSQEKKYITENGGEYSYDAEGHQTWRIGGVPVSFAVKGIPEVLEPAQAYLARQMRQNAKIDVPKMDGEGNQIGFERYVPVTTPEGDEDGMLVNFRSAIETFGQKITEDDLNDQFEKGFLKAVDGRTGKGKLMYAAGGLAIGAVGTLAVQWVTSKLAGGGGGGGSIVPLVIDAGGIFL